MKTCFIIGPGDGEGSDIRTRAAKIREIVERAVTRWGYQTEHAYQIATPGMIIDQVIRRLVECDVVIADLTTGNANVYYEMAIRHAVGKPTINLLDKNETLPFDLGGVRTIPLDMADQYGAEANIEKAIVELEKPDYKFTTPFEHALLRQAFHEQADQQQEVIREFFDSQSDKISSQLDELKNLTRQLEEATRKPLHGIGEVFAQIYLMLNSAKVGGRIWFVGMTLGLGPPIATAIVNRERMHPGSVSPPTLQQKPASYPLLLSTG